MECNVTCYVKEDNLPDINGFPIYTTCSFFITRPISLTKIKESFPFDGVFHYRIKLYNSLFNELHLSGQGHKIYLIFLKHILSSFYVFVS
jgi:hypothetical protein